MVPRMAILAGLSAKNNSAGFHRIPQEWLDSGRNHRGMIKTSTNVVRWLRMSWGSYWPVLHWLGCCWLRWDYELNYKISNILISAHTAVKGRICNQELNNPSSSTLVLNPSWSWGSWKNDATWCCYLMEFDFRHAWLCCWAHHSNQHHHCRSQYET